MLIPSYRYTSAFSITGTESYRLSSRKILGIYGGNEQNLSENARQYLIADPGKAIIQVDQAGAEALVVAHLCRRGNYMRLFELGIKPHTYLALNIFIDDFRGNHPRERYQFRTPDELFELPEWAELNETISSNPAHVTKYQLGKKVAHAKAYRMGPQTFRMQALKESQGAIRLSLAEAKSFLRTYDILLPEIGEWHLEVIEELSNTRILRNLFGFPRTFHGRMCEELTRKAVSYVPQSTVGVLTSMVFTEMQAYAEREGRDWEMLINAHDAVVAQAPVDEAVECATMIAELFRRPIQAPKGTVLRMKSEASIGPTWAKKDMKKVKI